LVARHFPLLLGGKLFGGYYMLFHLTTMLGHARKITKCFLEYLLENKKEKKLTEKHLVTIKTPFELGGNFLLT
jgi:hypothetical protein